MENGKMACLMEKAKWFILMAVCMWGTLKTEFRMERGDSSVLMDGITKESWKINKPKDRENSCMKSTAVSMKAIGSAICLMVSGGKLGGKIILFRPTKVNF
jgi:hypothetical protein